MNADAPNLLAETGRAIGRAPELDMRWLAFICVSLLALAFLAWWKSRRLEKTGRSPIRILGSRMLGGKRWLTLVEVEGTRLLLAVGAEETRLLKTFAASRKREGASEGHPKQGECKVAEPADAGGTIEHFAAEAEVLRLAPRIWSRRRSG